MRLSEAEVRLLSLSAPQLMKLLDEKESRLLNKLYGEVKNDNLRQRRALIEFSVIRDLKNDITAALRNFEAQEGKRHANANPEYPAD